MALTSAKTVQRASSEAANLKKSGDNSERKPAHNGPDRRQIRRKVGVTPLSAGQKPTSDQAKSIAGQSQVGRRELPHMHGGPGRVDAPYSRKAATQSLGGCGRHRRIPGSPCQPSRYRAAAPFGAPAALWLVATTLSFLDGRLVVLASIVFLAGIAAAFLLGAVRNPVKDKIGLAALLGGAVLIVYNGPDHASSDLILIRALFGIAWLGGCAVRQRTAEAARRGSARLTLSGSEDAVQPFGSTA